MDTMSSSEFIEWLALYKIEASEREQQAQRQRAKKR